MLLHWKPLDSNPQWYPLKTIIVVIWTCSSVFVFTKGKKIVSLTNSLSHNFYCLSYLPKLCWKNCKSTSRRFKEYFLHLFFLHIKTIHAIIVIALISSLLLLLSSSSSPSSHSTSSSSWSWCWWSPCVTTNIRRHLDFSTTRPVEIAEAWSHLRVFFLFSLHLHLFVCRYGMSLSLFNYFYWSFCLSYIESILCFNMKFQLLCLLVYLW